MHCQEQADKLAEVDRLAAVVRACSGNLGICEVQRRNASQRVDLARNDLNKMQKAYEEADKALDQAKRQLRAATAALAELPDGYSL